MIPRAFRLARMAHESIHQRRKYTNEPYYLHPWAVATLVMMETDDEAVVAAAALHDVAEDVPGFSLDGLDKRLLALVDELTHRFTPDAYPAMNRATRKRYEAQRISHTSSAARLIKTCDNLDNIRSIAQHDPKFAKTYAAEMRLYFDALPDSGAKAELRAHLERIESTP